MRTIHVGIGHDDYFMIANLAQVQCLRIFFCTEGNTQCSKYIAYFLTLEYLMLHRFLHIQDLTTQWQDGLNLTVATSLSGTTCRISLHEEQFTLSRVFALAVSQLAWQSTTTERRLSQYALTSITCSDTCLGCQDHFLNNLLGIIWVLFQVVAQCLTNRRRHHTGYLRVTQLGLCLTLELWLCYFHADDSGQTLAEVIRVDVCITIFVFQFSFLQHLALLSVFLHHASECRAETCHVCTTFDGVDIVHIAVYILVEIGVVDNRHLYWSTIFLGVQVNHL